MIEKTQEGKVQNLMNKHFVIFTDEARFDLIEISEGYGNKTPGLDIKFRKAVKNPIDKILSNPSSFASVNKRSKYRRCLTDTFPYKIYYRVSEKEITVVAIIHTSRSNSLIKRRLK